VADDAVVVVQGITVRAAARCHTDAARCFSSCCVATGSIQSVSDVEVLRPSEIKAADCTLSRGEQFVDFKILKTSRIARAAATVHICPQRGVATRLHQHQAVCPAFKP
jgi:hypothetical protein